MHLLIFLFSKFIHKPSSSSSASKHSSQKMKEETQWNDAQIRFGPYNSKLITSHSKDIEKTLNGKNDYDDSYGANANADVHSADRETFEFQFLVNLDHDHDHDHNNTNCSNNNSNDDDNDEEKKGEDEDQQLGSRKKLNISLTLEGFQPQSNITYCSTGLTMWPAAELVCNHLIQNPKLLQGKRTLELGSGLGLVGLLAHHIVIGDGRNYNTGACVHMTDGDSDALFQLRQNIAMNHISNNDSNGKNQSLSCNQLLWSKNNAESYLHDKAKDEKFDIILASDIIYAKSVVKPMWETVQVLLKENGYFLFAFARRQVAVNMKDILEEGKLAGFDYTECEETDQDENLFVYMFQRIT